MCSYLALIVRRPSMSLGGVRCKGSWLEVKGWIATAVNIATVVSVGGGDAEFTNQTSLNHFDSPTPIVLIRYRKNNVIPSFVVSFYKTFFFSFFRISIIFICVGLSVRMVMRHTDIPTWIVYWTGACFTARALSMVFFQTHERTYK